MRQSPDNCDAGDDQAGYVTDLRFYEELNEFLPQALRKKTIQVESREPRSVKDLIESLGVPHTEVDLVSYVPRCRQNKLARLSGA